MTSARDIARRITGSIDDDEDAARVASALQQAREDGARWMLEEVRESIEAFGHIWDDDDSADSVSPADVRKVAP